MSVTAVDVSAVCREDARIAFSPVRRQRILVLNQYYWPGVEATANLLTELCEALADDYDVTVIAGAAPEAPARQVRNGVEIVRVRSTTYERSRLSRRALNYLTYVVGVMWKGMFARRPDLVICMTDPPFIGSMARVVAARFRAPLLVIAQDVFPEIAVKLGPAAQPGRRPVAPRCSSTRRSAPPTGWSRSATR